MLTNNVPLPGVRAFAARLAWALKVAPPVKGASRCRMNYVDGNRLALIVRDRAISIFSRLILTRSPSAPAVRRF